MKRIDIQYGGNMYSVGGRDLTELQRHIADVATAPAGGGWMQVNDGEGEERPAYLLLTPGTSIAVIPVPDAA